MQLQEQIGENVRAAFPFDVEKFPLFGPDNARTSHYGLFRTDTGEDVGPAVRRGYRPHTTEDVVALTEAAAIGFEGRDGTEIDAKWFGTDSRQGHYVIIAPSADKRRSIFGERDNVFPRAVISATYGGGFRGSLGLWRDACANLAIPHQVGGVNVSIRHTGGLRDSMDQLIEQFQKIARGFEFAADGCEMLEAKRVDIAEFIGKLYPMPEDATKRTRNTTEGKVEAILSRLIHEREQTGRPKTGLSGATLWECVNAVTGYVQHDKPRRGERNNPTARALLATEDSEARAAWDLAFQMAGWSSPNPEQPGGTLVAGLMGCRSSADVASRQGDNHERERAGEAGKRVPEYAVRGG